MESRWARDTTTAPVAAKLAQRLGCPFCRHPANQGTPFPFIVLASGGELALDLYIARGPQPKPSVQASPVSFLPKTLYSLLAEARWRLAPALDWKLN